MALDRFELTMLASCNGKGHVGWLPASGALTTERFDAKCNVLLTGDDTIANVTRQGAARGEDATGAINEGVTNGLTRLVRDVRRLAKVLQTDRHDELLDLGQGEKLAAVQLRGLLNIGAFGTETSSRSLSTGHLLVILFRFLALVSFALAFASFGLFRSNRVARSLVGGRSLGESHRRRRRGRCSSGTRMSHGCVWFSFVSQERK